MRVTRQTESQLGSKHEEYGQHEDRDEPPRQHACLVIHGFAGGVHDVSPIAEFLSSKGCTVKCSTLPGHTGVNRDLGKAGYRDWLRSVECDLESLVEDDSVEDDSGANDSEGVTDDKDPGRSGKTHGRRRIVTIVGFSMGSLLAVNLATKYPVHSLVLLNTPVYCGNPKRVALNVIRDVKTHRLSNIRRYSRRLLNHPPARALFDFRTLLQKTKPLFSKVTCPVFIGQSMKDDTVQPRSANFVFEHVSSTRKVVRSYLNSGHVICHEPDVHRMLADVWRFLQLL